MCIRDSDGGRKRDDDQRIVGRDREPLHSANRQSGSKNGNGSRQTIAVIAAADRVGRRLQPIPSHSVHHKQEGRQSNLPPLLFVVNRMRRDWLQTATDAIRRSDHRNGLAGAVAVLGAALAIGGMEWLSVASHYPLVIIPFATSIAVSYTHLTLPTILRV